MERSSPSLYGSLHAAAEKLGTRIRLNSDTTYYQQSCAAEKYDGTKLAVQSRLRCTLRQCQLSSAP